MAVINREIGNSDDFISRDMTVCGFDFCCLTMENLCDKQQIEQQIIRRLMSVKSLPKNGKQRFEAVESGICASPDQKKVQNIDELYRLIMSGWAALLLTAATLRCASAFRTHPPAASPNPARKFPKEVRRRVFGNSPQQHGNGKAENENQGPEV